MKIAIVTTDNRQNDRRYHLEAPYFGTAPEALLEGFALLKEHEFHVLSCTQQAMVSPRQLADNIFFHSLTVPKRGWLRSGYLGCIGAVRRRVRELQPDLVHGQGTERDCAISAVFCGFPNVVTIHGNMWELARLFPPRWGSYGWCTARLEQFTLARCQGVFCNSEYTENLVAGRTRRTWRVPNALRSRFFSDPSPVASIGPSNPDSQRPVGPVLLNVGVISPRKRQLELLALARSLHEEGVAFSLHFIGYADPNNGYAARFLQAMEQVGQAGYARYLGTQSTTELIGSFDQAAGFLHFPLEESFGLVVAEALARGMRFFGARVGGILDIVEGTQGSLLFAPEDWQGLAQALKEWARAGFPAAPPGDREVMRRYQPERIARRHLEIYEEVLRTRW